MNCSDLSLHNNTVLRLRRLGHQWPTTNGDEPVETYFSAPKMRAHPTERARQRGGHVVARQGAMPIEIDLAMSASTCARPTS